MRTIAFYTPKGGVGKTTTAGHIASLMAQYGRTLMVDADPQGNLSNWFVPDRFSSELADVLLEEKTLREVVISVRPQLSILPTFSIDGELNSFRDSQTVINHLNAFVDLQRAAEEAAFDYLVIDLSPGSSTLETSLLGITDEVVAVASAEFFGYDGLEIYEDVVASVRKRYRRTILAEKAVLNRVNRAYALHRAFCSNAETLDYRVYEIGQSTGVSDCIPSHQTVFEFAPKDRTIPTFRRLAEDLTRWRG